MKQPTDFLYWLSGLLEYTDIDSLTHEQSKTLLKGINDHLALVVKKETPDHSIKEVVDKKLSDFDEAIKKFQEAEKTAPRINPSTWPKTWPGTSYPTIYPWPYTPPRDYTYRPWGTYDGPIC